MFQMDGKIFNSRGVHVANIRGNAVYDLKGDRILRGKRNENLQALRRARRAYPDRNRR